MRFKSQKTLARTSSVAFAAWHCPFHLLLSLSLSLSLSLYSFLFFQAGFIGCWGEWHGSIQRLEFNSTAVAAIVAAELKILLPSDKSVHALYLIKPSRLMLYAFRYMMMRYGPDKCCGRDGQGGALRSAYSRSGALLMLN